MGGSVSTGQSVRRTLAVAFVLLAIVAGSAALAWACSPVQGWISAHGPSGDAYGPAGSAVTVNGTNFDPAGSVQIYWNGAHVGSASGSPFTTTIAVPNVPEGQYSVQAVGQAANGSGERTSAATFWVGLPPALQQPPPGTPSTGGDDDSASAGAAAPSSRSAAARTSSGDVRSGSSSATTSGGDGGAAGRANGNVSGGEGTRGTGAHAGDSGGVVTTGSGQAVFADSLGAGGPKGAGPAAPRSKSPSERSASGGLWSGFTAGETTTAADLGFAAATSDGPGSALTLSVALGGLGLLALMSGAAATEVRRRRATVRGDVGAG